jgi:hypothetical protein
VTVGHFHDPKILDIAASNFGSGTVSILLSNGDGTFRPARPRDYDYGGGGAGGSAVGDFRGNGVFDLAVANGNDVSVLLGNGDGSFQPPVHYDYAAGALPVAVAVEDFDGDGNQDLAVANFGDGTVSVLLGNGDGTFQPAVPYAAGTTPADVAVGDFNGDNIPDLAVTNLNDGSVSVLLGKGDGTFQPPVPYDVGTLPGQVVVEDFNGDGIQDLATQNRSGTVSVLLGNGDGSFQPARPRDYDAGPDYPNSLATADFNGDGMLDLAVTNRNSAKVSILLGNGDGTFQAPQSSPAGLFPAGLSVAADFNGDGFPDLAFGNATDPGTVTVLLNAADWSGGRQAAPLHRPASHRAVPSRSPLEGVAAMTAASRPQAVFSLALTSTDLRSNPVPQSSVPTETGQPAQPQATVAPRSVSMARHAQDAVFERWSDPVLDVPAWNLVR